MVTTAGYTYGYYSQILGLWILLWFFALPHHWRTMHHVDHIDCCRMTQRSGGYALKHMLEAQMTPHGAATCRVHPPRSPWSHFVSCVRARCWMLRGMRHALVYTFVICNISKRGHSPPVIPSEQIKPDYLLWGWGCFRWSFSSASCTHTHTCWLLVAGCWLWLLLVAGCLLLIADYS
jgi:hypothetical protein